MANISMDPRPTNYLRQNIVFSYPEMIRVSFSLFLSLSVFCYFTLLLIFIKIILLLLLLFFMKIIFYFFMFRDVPECSGMFRNVPCSGFYRRPKIARHTPMYVQKHASEMLGRLCWFFRGKHHPDSRWSWVVCISSAVCGAINTGFVLSFGVLFPELMEHFDETTETTGENITLHVFQIH